MPPAGHDEPWPADARWAVAVAVEIVSLMDGRRRSRPSDDCSAIAERPAVRLGPCAGVALLLRRVHLRLRARNDLPGAFAACAAVGPVHPFFQRVAPALAASGPAFGWYTAAAV